MMAVVGICNFIGVGPGCCRTGRNNPPDPPTRIQAKAQVALAAATAVLNVLTPSACMAY